MGYEPFVAEISMLGFDFVPRGYATCYGQLLAIRSNTALFALLGITYGGDGRTTFALPNLQSRVPIGAGAALGLTSHVLGEIGGVESVTLTTSNLPDHAATLNLKAGGAPNSISPKNNYPATMPSGTNLYATAAGTGFMKTITTTDTTAAGVATPVSHLNSQPSLATNFCIALSGIFPQRP